MSEAYNFTLNSEENWFLTTNWSKFLEDYKSRLTFWGNNLRQLASQAAPVLLQSHPLTFSRLEHYVMAVAHLDPDNIPRDANAILDNLRTLQSKLRTRLN